MPLPNKHRFTTFSNTGSIKPMGFRVVLACAIEFGSRSCAYFERVAGLNEKVVKLPTGDVDNRRVLECFFGLLLHFGMTKFSGGLRPFLEVTDFTGNRQVAHPI